MYVSSLKYEWNSVSIDSNATEPISELIYSNIFICILLLCAPKPNFALKNFSVFFIQNAIR